MFRDKGKIQITILQSDTSLAQIAKLFANHQLIIPLQKVNYNDFVTTKSAYDDDEYKQMLIQHQQRQRPLLGRHDVLRDLIVSELNRCSQGKSRKCIQCKKKNGIFEKHAICMDRSESNSNVSNHVAGRVASTINVIEVTDPADAMLRHREPYQTITTNPCLWATFLMKLFLQTIYTLKTNDPTLVLNCRLDSDWKRLSFKAEDFLFLVNEVIHDVVSKDKSLVIDSRDIFVKKIFTTCCGVYIMRRDEVDEYDDDDISNINEEIGTQVHVYFRSHYIPDETLDKADFVDFWVRHWRDIQIDDCFVFQ